MKLTHFLNYVQDRNFSLLRKLIAYRQYRKRGYFVLNGWKHVLIID